MKRVDQQRTQPSGHAGEDSLRACLASLLELPLGAVPEFTDAAPADLYRAVDTWLATSGRALVRFCLQGPQPWLPPGVPYIAFGPATRQRAGRSEEVSHAVVACDGVMVHDPHPSRAGLQSEKWLGFVVVSARGWIPRREEEAR